MGAVVRAGRRGAAGVISTAVIVAGGLLMAGPAGPATAAGAVRSPSASLAGWNSAQQVAAGLNQGALAAIVSISCPSTGSCSAGGYYTGSGDSTQALVITESDGRWDSGEEVPGTAGLNAGDYASVNTISCVSPGNCVAGGYTLSSQGPPAQTFLVQQTNGVWGSAQVVLPGGNSEITSVSCVAVGYCAAGGFHGDSAVVMTQAHGRWSGPHVVVTGAAGTAVGQVSCQGKRAGCAAAGEVVGTSNRGFLVSSKAGVWGRTRSWPAPVQLDAVSCPAPGDCVAGGSDGTAGAVITQTKGTWGPVTKLRGKDTVSYLSCPATGDCTAAGGGSVIDESDGQWGSWQPVPGLATLATKGNPIPPEAETLSCGRPGDCVVGGGYNTYLASEVNPQPRNAFLASEHGGIWGKAFQAATNLNPSPGVVANVTAVSCADTGYCGAGGYYWNGYQQQRAFVMSQAPLADSTTTVSVSHPSVTFGAEQDEYVSADVARSGSLPPPAGTVTVTANGHTLCTIDLSGGDKFCRLHPVDLAAARYQVLASYSGDANYLPSRSDTKTFSVTKASTTTGLRMSAVKLRYGHEAGERLKARVAPQYAGLPAGTVTIKTQASKGSAGTTICKIALYLARGSCKLTRKQLKAGTYRIYASYGGDQNFRSSSSLARKLTVVR
jgi:hypothetical protein